MGVCPFVICSSLAKYAKNKNKAAKNRKFCYVKILPLLQSFFIRLVYLLSIFSAINNCVLLHFLIALINFVKQPGPDSKKHINSKLATYNIKKLNRLIFVTIKNMYQFLWETWKHKLQVQQKNFIFLYYILIQWFSTGEKFLPRKNFMSSKEQFIL